MRSAAAWLRIAWLAAEAGLSRAAALAGDRLFAGNLRVDPAAFLQAIHAYSDDRIARRQTGGDLGFVVFRGSDGNGTHGHGLVRIHQPYVGALRVALNPGGGPQRNVLFLFHQQAGVYELAGVQLTGLVGENRAQLQRASGRIDLVVDGLEL